MKPTRLVILLLLLSPLAAEPPADMRAAIKRLFENSRKWSPKPPFTFKDGTFHAGRHRFTLNPIVERSIPVGTDTAMGVHFDVTLDGKKVPELTYGCVGMGANVEKAQRDVIGNWYMGFGQTLGETLGGKPGSLTFHHYQVHITALSIRGQANPDQMPKETAILRILEPLLSWKKPFHTLEFKVGAGPGGIGHIQLFADGKETTKGSLLEKLDWPKSESGYLLKQVYLLTKD